MIIRSALLLGQVAADRQEDFDRHMREVVVAKIRQYPRILDVTLRKTQASDDGAPEIYMQFDLMFDSLADMDAALASPVRDAVRAEIIAGMGDFQGRTVHVVSQALG
ncbi:EthD family reductase [Pararhodobacter oceanensis]|uniref:EthD family reductase n=1 Tax=Pararhodobacter oceanensis TaxID=2172121 RepID=UPI003A8C94A5